jgi:hypothetical protein
MDQGFARTALPRRKRRLFERFALAALLPALFLAASVSPAGAVVTIGSNLAREPNSSASFSPRPTFSNVALASNLQASGGLSSPVNGTVVRWRIRVGSPTGVINLRIIRPLGGGLFTGAGTSASVTPPINATTTYAAQLPIRIGDYIGIDCCERPAPSAEFFRADVPAIRDEWQPSLADGGTGRAPTGTFLYEVALNADITTTFTVNAIRRNKKIGTATLTVTVPFAGELTGAGKGIKVANAAVNSMTVSAPGSVQLLIKARGRKKKKKLNSTGKVKVKPKITYTPTGGEPATKSLKVKLKKKL